MKRSFRLILVPLVLLHLMGADVYRWVDRNGVVNYTQQAPPSGIEGERIVMRGGGLTTRVGQPARIDTASPDAAPGQSTDLENLNPEQQQMLENYKRAEAARQAEVAKIRQSNCVKAREVLERLSGHGRVRVRDASGVERAMPEEERQTRIAEAQRAIVTNCEA